VFDGHAYFDAIVSEVEYGEVGSEGDIDGVVKVISEVD
jgi:hypothetical protein